MSIRSQIAIRRWIARWTIAVALALCVAAPAGAVVIVLQDFESYTPGSDTVGDVSVEDATFGVTPTQGTQQLLLTSEGTAVTDAAAETAMGLTGGTIQSAFDTHIANLGLSTGTGPTEGSAFQITFTAEAGDLLEFDWNFLSDEVSPSPGNDPPDPGLYTDFGWFFLEDPSAGTGDGVLSHANDPNVTFATSGATGFLDETGYQTITMNLNQTGTYTLTLGANDVQDANDNWASALVVDYFRLVRGPEPGTFGTLAGGLIALSWLSRRRQRTRQR